MSPSMLLDVVIVALLVPTIVYAVILNRKLEGLRRNRDELTKMIAAFQDATVRAEAGIPKMKKAVEEVGATLRDSMERAQTLRDDLAFMSERADSMANRLEAHLREARGAARPGLNLESPVAAVADLPEPLGMDRVREIGEGARVVGGIAPGPTLLSALLADEAAGFDGREDERSEAERQLLRAIRAAR
ncbi:DUF6468 domain-containing protein [Oleispirillum naphthae]|uniref:DUF6468 domain-containing protein n=1 Tax=Oleispirillum naphthae TaxID=2838853 RepID=UPI00308266E1